MGTDIHIFVENKHGRNRKRYHFMRSFDGDRIYGIFSALAGVNMREIKPLFKPRGLPDDVTNIVYKQYINGKADWHHPSWLTTQEFKECLLYAEQELKAYCQHMGEEYNEDCTKSYWNVYAYAKDLEDPGEPSRIIFWFDN